MKLLGDWSIWDWACLRAPGFPAERVLALAAPRAVVATDRLAAETAIAAAARDIAIAALQRAPASKPVNRALRALQRGAAPASVEGLGDVAGVVDAAIRAEAARALAQDAATASLDSDGRGVAELLNTIAGESRFREALLWQNRTAVHQSIASLLKRPPEATDSRTREYRRLVASCVQRYCAKNDTIGFFGPVGWARIADVAEPIAVRAGTALEVARTVYFEYWCIDSLAMKLASDPELRPQLVPRRTPIGLEGNVVHAAGRRIELPELFARALHAIDGDATAHAIAQQLRADASLELADDGEVFEVLAELERKGLCTWTLEIPTATFHPERYLRELLVRAGVAGERGLRLLEALELRRTAIAAAAGDPDALDRALGDLESTFEELTDASATRKGGQTYAGRTLVFEDCRRDVEVELGRGLVDDLGPALGLVLDSARWYTHAIATRYDAVFRAVFAELRAATGEPVDYLRFRDRLAPHFPGPDADHGIAYDVAAQLQQQWAAILGVDEAGTAPVITRTSDELRAAVAAAFAAPSPGWPSARHHSPDVLIAAADVDAIRRGDYHFVLGEIHVGFNTVTLPCLLKEHPDPDVLVRAREADLPAPGVAPVWSKARNRADFFSVSRHDFDVETGETRSGRPRDHVLVAGALVVDEVDGQLVVRPRAGGPSFHAIAFLEQHLIAESFSRFRLLGRRAHLPRVVVDRVVVQRESWLHAAGSLAFADDASELGRFLGARTFAARHGMPRLVYAKTDAEAKPFFVDFDSPILVEVFARQIKRCKRVTISEMSPGVTECWLADAAGNRYTSELRLAATDARAWSPAVAG